MRAHPIPAAAIALAAVLGSPAATAQQAPDAGRLLDERTPPKALPRQRAEPAITEAPVRPAMRAPAGARFKVDRIRFAGNTVFSDAELAPQVQSVLGTEATLAELEAAADNVARHYRERGWFVTRAYVPAQDVVNGEVEIQVREGRLGEIQVQGQGTRIAAARLQALVESATGPLAATPLLRQDDLERAMLLMNDLPGVQAQATLMPGTRLATTHLRVDVQEGPRVSGMLGYDNQGNRYSGAHRPSLALQLNDPAGIGDQLKLAYSGLASSPYLNTTYSLPLGSSGLRVSAHLVATRYRLCCEFKQLSGRAGVAGLQASYPLLRSRLSNLTATLGVDHRSFVDRFSGETTSDKTAQTWTLGANYDAHDDRLGGGLLFANLDLTDGRLSQRMPAKATDHYTKLNLFAARLQALPAELALYAGLTAQLARAPLDSSEKMALGGPNAVRAYPADEGAGHSAAVLNLELRRGLGNGLQGFVFVDAGRVHVAQGTDRDPALRRYGLAGAGLGLGVEAPAGWSLRGVLAAPICGNPGRSVIGNDSDGRHSHVRVWLQAGKAF